MATSLLTLKRVSSSDNVPFDVQLNDSDEVEVLIDEIKVLTEQQSNIANLTDSTGGTTDGTLAAISGSGADSDINNNFAELNEKIDSIITALEAHGLTADS